MAANVHIQQILIKRGNTAQIANYTGPIGEPIYNTQTHAIHLQDGATAGGHALATATQLANTISIIEGIQGGLTSNIEAILANIQGVDLTSITANITELQSNLFHGGNANIATISNSDFINLVANGQGVQVQWDPSGTNRFDLIENGSWFYINSDGLVFQSNTTGTIKTAQFTNAGGITSSDQVYGRSFAVGDGSMTTGVLGYTGIGSSELALDSYGNILLTSDDPETGPQWNFDTDGNLRLPESNDGQAGFIAPFDKGISFFTTDVESGPTVTRIHQNGMVTIPNNLYVLDNRFVVFDSDGNVAQLAGASGENFNLHVGGFANKVWTFNQADGSLTTPGAVKTSLISNTGSGRVTIDPDGTSLSYVRVDGFDDGGERVVISNQLTGSYGIYFYTEGGNFFRMHQNQLGFSDGSWQTTAFTDGAVSNYLNSGNLESAWIHGNLTVGNLIVNGNSTVINTQSYTIADNIITMADGNPADTLDLGFVAHRTVASQIQHTGLIRDASANNWKLFSNVIPSPGNTVDFTYAVYDDLVAGNISSPTITDLYANAAIQAASLATLTANAASQAADITTLYANAATQNTSINTINANIGGFYTYANATYSTVANAAFQNTWLSNLQSNINTINANIGGFYTYANATYSTVANAAFQNTWLSNLQSNVNTINANIGGFYTWANANFGSSNYSNSNVASYLPTYSGNVSAGNVITTNGIFWSNGTAWSSSGGTTYTNANVVSMLSANSLVTIGNTNPFPILSNITSVLVGGNLALTSGQTFSQQNSTAILNNVYVSANGAMMTRNTGYASAMTMYNGGFAFVSATGSQTANTVPTMNTVMQVYNGSTGIYFYQPITFGAAAASSIQAVGPSSFSLLTTGVTTLNIGSAATTIPIGATTVNLQVGGSTMTGNISAGNITATQYGNSIGTTATYSGNITAGNVISTGAYTVASITTTGSYGNITGANVVSANTISATNFVYSANGVNILTGVTGTYSNSNVASYLPTYTGNIAANIVHNGNIWTFDDNGNLTLPGTQSPLVTSGHIINVKGIHGLTASSGATIDGFNTVSAENFTFANGTSIIPTSLSSTDGANTLSAAVTTYNGQQASMSTGQVNSPFDSVSATVLSSGGTPRFNITTSNSGVLKSWVFTNTSLTFPDLSVQTTAYGNANVAAYLVANPQAGTYSNTNVSAYLTTATVATTGNLSAGNILTTNGVFWAGNGAAYSSGSGGVQTSVANGSSSLTFASSGGNGVFQIGGVQTATFSQGSIAMIGNISATANVTAANIVATQYGNSVGTTATYSGNVTAANVILTNSLIFPDGTSQTSTYSNANVVSMLTANSLVTIGNVNPYPLQSNITQVVVGPELILSSGAAGNSTSTYLMNNVYYDVNGAQRYRNTQTGALQLAMSGVSGLVVSGTSSGVTGNAVTGMGLWATIGGSGISTSNGLGISSSGSLTTTTGALVSGATTGTLFNSIATTVNIGGAAYTMAIGASNVVATFGSGTGNIVAGNITATQYGNSIGTTATYSGNVTAANVVVSGNIYGTLATTANITTSGNVTAPNFIGTTPNVSLVAGSYTANWDNTGNLTLSNGNIYVLGGTGLGGVYALDVGVNNPWYSNTIASFNANVNNYTQVTLQNLSNGTAATSDFIATADNGTNATNYVDLGIINSGYNNATPNNSLGNIVYNGDSYLYAQGNTSSTFGGNLAIGTTTASRNITFFAGGNTNASIIGTITSSGLQANVAPAVASTPANGTGYIGLPQNSQSSNYQLVAADAGKHVYISSTSNVTIPANGTVAFPIGTVITFIAGPTTNANILITTDTMYLAGIGSTGTRQLAPYGMATAVKTTATTWFINGTGLV